MMADLNDDHDTPPKREDERSDIQQAFEARKDAVERGEGGPESNSITAPDLFSGNAWIGR